MAKINKFIGKLFSKKMKPYFDEIELDKILIGQQSGLPLEKWVEKTKEFERVSVGLIESPYVLLLQDLKNHEELLDNDDFITHHSYYKMAFKVLKNMGHYFGAKNEKELIAGVKNFFSLYKNFDQNILESNRKIPEKKKGQSGISAPIKLSKIKESEYYEVVDGHHRLAINWLYGKKKIDALIVGEKYTYLQNLLFKCIQTHGDPELYQPINRPEVGNWHLVRLCHDRFELMKDFLDKIGYNFNKNKLLDISCSYGWFLNEFKKKGFDVLGIERDGNAIRIGEIIYGIKKDEFEINDVARFLNNNRMKYDIVLFLSILHHFAIKKETGDVRRILKQLDQITNNVLFLDTGQNHERWNTERLKAWDDEFIINLIKETTSFHIYPLGKDKDARGIYGDQYSRTLFACVKE